MNPGSGAAALMGTLVRIDLVDPGRDDRERRERGKALERAFEWFRRLEKSCSRFDPASEIRRLAANPRSAVPVSPIVFEALRFALAVAQESGGAFDPAVGLTMEAHGFDRAHQTGQASGTGMSATAPVSYRDVHLEEEGHLVTLAKPLLLDLGAVAKGMAIDLAAQELRPFGGFVINAGGDVYAAGRNGSGQPWSIGIQHPRDPGALIERIRVSDMAVCTSGDYERPTPDGKGGHHLMDPRTRRPSQGVSSATVVAPSALVADALATAAFVLGPREGIDLLRRHGVEGMIFTADLRRAATPGLAEISETVLAAERPR